MNDTKKIYDLFLKSSGVCTDTRKIKENNLFFALSGENFNGNRFAAEALKKGALAAVVDDPDHLPDGDSRYFLVRSSLETLQQLARFHRQQFTIPVLAITGTNGKTTTKELCAAVLASEKNICATKGNFNNHIGVPLTLLEINNRTEMAVVEMGANHPGEIAALCRIAQPTHGLITNMGKAHLEGFGSFQGVVKAKTELYRAIKQQKGTVLVNKDDALLMELSAGLARKTYGTPPADTAGRLKQNNTFITVEWLRGDSATEIRTQLYGSYNFANVMAALAVGRLFGIESGHVAEAVSRYQPKNNRSQVLQTANNHVILDAYNANPGSMSLALEDFAAHRFPHPVLILGDMFELGDAAQEEHKKIADKTEQLGFTEVILVGENFSRVKTHPGFVQLQTTDDLLRFLPSHPVKNAHILVKGSRGMALEKIIQYL